MSLKERYCTLVQLADEIGVTRQTVHRWIVQKKLTAEKVGRERLIARTEITRLRQALVKDWLEQMATWFVNRKEVIDCINKLRHLTISQMERKAKTK